MTDTETISFSSVESASHQKTGLISVIVLTYNRKDKLKRCLESIQSQQHNAKEIIVVDNASSDGTAHMMQQSFSGVRYIQLAHNHGAGSGRNIGASHASGNWLVFLDDDIFLPHDDMLHRLTSYMQQDTVVIFTVTEPGGAIFTNYIPRRDKQLQSNDSPCCCLLSGAFAIRCDVWHKLDGFWPMLDPYGYEDRELGFRIMNAGYPMLWSRSIEVCHDKAENPDFNPDYFRYMLPHHGWVALRHLPWRYVASHIFIFWPYLFFLAVRHGQIVVYLKSIMYFVRGIPCVLRVRRRIAHNVLSLCKRYSGRLLY